MDKAIITPKIFWDFLRKKNFETAWKEAYIIDNLVYEHDVPFNKFFNDCPPVNWFYTGIGCVIFKPTDEVKSYAENNPKFADVLTLWTLWRKKYMSITPDIDEEWMNFVNKKLNNGENV